VNITKNTVPTEVFGRGLEELVVTNPGKLMFQVTGAGANTFLNEGPPAGKMWTCKVHLSFEETDI